MADGDLNLAYGPLAPSGADQAIVNGMFNSMMGDFAELEGANFERMQKLFADFETLLEAFFNETKTPSLVANVATVSVWAGVQVALFALDQVGDDTQMELNAGREAVKELTAGCETDWRASIIVNVVRTMLASFRKAQADSGKLPADLQRLMTKLRTKAGIVQ